MGAAIALNASLSHNWRICSVVVIGAASKMIVNDAILEGLQNTFEVTVDNIVKYSWHKKTGAIADSQQMASFFREKAKRRMLNSGPETVYRDFLACSKFDLSQRLEEIAVPVLVVASDCDRMVPLNLSWELSEILRNSYFVCLENCGHFQHIEQTGKVAGELVTFLSKLPKYDELLNDQCSSDAGHIKEDRKAYAGSINSNGKSFKQGMSGTVFQPRCPSCGRSGYYLVHGHGQCAHCKINVMPCCDGENCQQAGF